MRLGVTELVLILVVALVIFGPGKLPELGKALGRSLKEFKEATKGLVAEAETVKKDVEKTVEQAGQAK